MFRKNRTTPLFQLIAALAVPALVGLASGSAAAHTLPPIPGIAVSAHTLAKVQGKGEPVSLPSNHSQNPGVILWDELPGKGGKVTNVQMGSMNLQNNTMLSNR